MDEPESSPAYLAHCADAFLKALREPEALVAADRVGIGARGNALDFAADFAAVIAEGREGRQSASVPLAEVQTLRGMLRKAQGLLGRQQTVP